ncbi:MAG TPA: APC family permease [Bryobacteraceae bacterium]|jgi:amino acid transporter
MAAFCTPRSKMNVLALSAATFFMVSGGPYGTEEIVQQAGYAGALLVLLLLPLLWALPTSMMVGELAAAIPEEGGFYVWVRDAMGPFWGFQEAWLSLASSIFDMAAYPAVFVLSLGQLWAPALQDRNRILISIAIISICVLWNLFGANAVGEGSIGLGLVLLTPFALLVILAIFRTHLSAAATSAAPAADAHKDWIAAIVVGMWNYMGWDNASTVAQEVREPQRTYPRVMLWTVLAIFIVYALPILAAWWIGIPAASWTTGSWVAVAQKIGGPTFGSALGNFVLLGTMISVLGIMNSLTMSYSRIPVALAEDGYAPRALVKQLRNGAPWVALIACGAAWMLALGLSFDRILLLDIMLYGLSLILEFVALVILRLRQPKLARPFQVPGGIAGALLLGIGPTALLAAAFAANRDDKVGEMSAATLALVLMLAGVLVYGVREAYVRRARTRHAR